MSSTKAWAEKLDEDGKWKKLKETADSGLELIQKLCIHKGAGRGIRIHEGETVMEIWSKDTMTRAESAGYKKKSHIKQAKPKKKSQPKKKSHK